MTDDAEPDLEQAFRDGLAQAADRAEVGVPLAARAHSGAAARRRRRWAVVGTVAATAVAASGVAVAVRSGDEPGRRPGHHAVTQPTTTPTTPITDWRAESWHGLTVDVPADWGWGTAPMRFPDQEQAYLCGDPAPDAPYVGRPIMLSDACSYESDVVPTAPYVWLGADVEAGTVDLGGGYTQETVEAFGSTLTVAAQDPAVRQHVLDSARATADCEARLPSRPEVLGIPTEGLDPVHSAQLCAYQPGEGGFELVYASTLDEATARSLYGGDALGSKREEGFCSSKFSEYVLVRFSGKDAMGDAELTADWVVDPGCQQVEIGPGSVLPLKQAGLDALTSGTGLPRVLRAFIGMLG